MMITTISLSVLLFIISLFVPLTIYLNHVGRPEGKIPSFKTRFTTGTWDADQIDKAILVIVSEWIAIHPKTSKRSKKLLDRLNLRWEHHRWTKNKQSIVGEFSDPTTIRLWRGPAKSTSTGMVVRINYTALVQATIQYLHQGIFKESLTIDQVYSKYGKMISKIHSKTESINAKI